MLNPCEKRIIAPSFRFGATSFVYSAGCAISGASITITSAPSTASDGPTKAHPSCSACFHEGPPRRRPTTVFTLLSRRFSACARPWLPYPSTATRLPSSVRGFASFTQNILAIVILLFGRRHQRQISHCESLSQLRSSRTLCRAYAALVTAPSDAEETSFAYFAITPVL